MISIQDVVYEYIRRDDEEQVVGVELAVDHLSFEINKGEFIAVLGHNGSGKSTLAKLINAILVPGEGCIEVDGYKKTGNGMGNTAARGHGISKSGQSDRA